MLPKICLTASALLILENKVLLIKHKKLNKWLGPGGHIDEGEFPHQAAKREFLEETGLEVEICSAADDLTMSSDDDVFHPLPFAIGEHWVCKENFERRLSAFKNNQPFIPEKKWKKGCEKHFNFAYLAKLTGPLEINPQEGESKEIVWFSLKDLQDHKEELASSILAEAMRAFELSRSIKD